MTQNNPQRMVHTVLQARVCLLRCQGAGQHIAAPAGPMTTPSNRLHRPVLLSHIDTCLLWCRWRVKGICASWHQTTPSHPPHMPSATHASGRACMASRCRSSHMGAGHHRAWQHHSHSHAALGAVSAGQPPGCLSSVHGQYFCWYTVSVRSVYCQCAVGVLSVTDISSISNTQAYLYGLGDAQHVDRAAAKITTLEMHTR
jgi:hypothetical protein